MNDEKAIGTTNKGAPEIRERTYRFGLNVVALLRSGDSRDLAYREITKQLIRASTSIGANMEEAFAGLTKRDFVHSMNIGRKESRESKYWLRLLKDLRLADLQKLEALLKENEEIIRILTAIVKKAQNRSSILLVLISSFILHHFPLFAEQTGAAFLKIPAGARAVGMASAFTAVADDASALYWNPAGTSRMSRPQALAMHSDWLLDMTHEFAAFVRPTQKGAWGVGASYLSQGTFEGRDDNRRATGDFGASDLAGIVSFSQRKRLGSLGLNVKVIQQRIESETAQGLAFDLGSSIQYPGSPLSFGAALQNLGPGMRFFKETYSLPLTASVGSAWEPWQGFTLALDLRQRIHTGNTSVSLGTEFWAFNAVALRGGYLSRVGSFAKTDSGLKSVADSRLESFTGLGAGVGIRLFNYQLDYALTPYGELGNTQRLSLQVEF